MEKEHLSTIWPILYFKADWALKTYEFDLDVQLIKADKTTLEVIAGIDSNAFGTNIEGSEKICWNTDWFLATSLPHPTEHVSAKEIGLSFENRFQEAIVKSFLMSLRLVRSTAAICPVGVKAKICDNSIDNNSIGDQDFYGFNFDYPPVYQPETFKVGDLQLLQYLWSALIKLRRLDLWRELIYKEEFFAALDERATEQTKLREKMIQKLLPELKGEFWGEEERKRFYQMCFRAEFSEEEDEVFSNRTRIGRALNLFFEGLHLPLQHSFLSMCLVLETIFTVEEAEITYQFATRLANITGKTFEQRKDIFERARKVYRERSNIVHGRKSIKTVEPNILKDAFFFARQSLQHILFDDMRMKLYSDPITSDKTKDSDKAIKAIKEYFRNLDLR